MQGSEKQRVADRSMGYLITIGAVEYTTKRVSATRAVVDACDAVGETPVTVITEKGKAAFSRTNSGIVTYSSYVTELREGQCWLCIRHGLVYWEAREHAAKCSCAPLVIDSDAPIANEGGNSELKVVETGYADAYKNGPFRERLRKVSSKVQELCAKYNLPVLRLEYEGIEITFSGTRHGREAAEEFTRTATGDFVAPDGYEWWCEQCRVSSRRRSGDFVAIGVRMPGWTISCQINSVLR